MRHVLRSENLIEQDLCVGEILEQCVSYFSHAMDTFQILQDSIHRQHQNQP